MSEKVFEAGNEYRTRDGRAARIYATGTGGTFPIHGAIFDKETNDWEPVAWTNGGLRLDGGFKHSRSEV